MSRTYRIRHLPRLELAKHFAWSTNEFAPYIPRFKEPNVPILSPHYHPWVSYGANIRVNTHYRAKAHRRMRRISKHLLNKSGLDYDALLYPKWWEHFDPWMFT